MEKLHHILTDLEQGKISADHAEEQILDLFAVNVSFEHGEKLCDCPECGAEIVYGLSKETMVIFKNSRLFMDAEPKYKVGQKIKVGNWGGETKPLEILDIQKTYHKRLQKYCWGYKMDGFTGLTMEYVPEGYLRP